MSGDTDPASREAWRPSASLEMLRLRARVLVQLRDFFQQRGILEVETPICSRSATTDPAIASLATRYTGPAVPQGQTLYLHTSPEFAMKRLLAAGSGPIYQICKVFRDGESGRRHNPEFSLLEWYRPGFDHHDLMDELARLLVLLVPAWEPVKRLSYRRLFQEQLGVDPHLSDAARLRQCAMECGLSGVAQLELAGRDAWLDLLMSHVLEPRIGAGPCFIYDYPASQAALARVRQGDPPVAQRFELYIDGVEIANGFHELTDALEQRRRFEQDLAIRAAAGQTLPPMDQQLLGALAHGLPACAGVAVGIDRLLMRIADATHIDQLLAFPLSRA